jgi:tRNA dimethylallyltransferase
MGIASSRPPLVVIAGPTASGKSALGLALAERTGGVLVNADSAQVYCDLPILSAAPSKEDLKRADHRLYGIVDGARPCSAADWASMARDEIAAIHSQGKLPILVGGTGLYLRTLLNGIAPVPPIDPAIRSDVRSASQEENRARLIAADPDAAERIGANDSSRTARALEVMLSTGRSLRDWQSASTGGIGGSVELKPFILLPPRAWLYPRCDRRFVEMVEQGGVQEVERLLSRQLPAALPVMRAIGVPELARYFHGELSLQDAMEAGQQSTRRYAKRQYTWFAHQPPADWPRLTVPAEGSAGDTAVDAFLRV